MSACSLRQHQRRREADRVLAGAEHEQPARERRVHHRVALGRSRAPWSRGRAPARRRSSARAAHVADERVLVHQRRAARPSGARRRRPRSASAPPCSSLIVASAAAHDTGLPPNVLACAPGGHVHHVGARDGHAERHARRDALRDGDDVGLDAEVLDREHLARCGPCPTALRRRSAGCRACVVSSRSRCMELRRRRRRSRLRPGSARRRSAATSSGETRCTSIWCFDEVEALGAAASRASGRPGSDSSRHTARGTRPASAGRSPAAGSPCSPSATASPCVRPWKPPRNAMMLVPLGRVPRQLDAPPRWPRCRSCRRTTAPRPSIGAIAGHLLRQPHLRLVVEVGARHVQELLRLLDDRLHHVGMRVPGGVDGDAGGAVEEHGCRRRLRRRRRRRAR